jgi:hypothetical protein
MTESEERQAVQLVREALGYPFEVTPTPVQVIERGPGGKFAEFLWLLGQ